MPITKIMPRLLAYLLWLLSLHPLFAASDETRIHEQQWRRLRALIYKNRAWKHAKYSQSPGVIRLHLKVDPFLLRGTRTREKALRDFRPFFQEMAGFYDLDLLVPPGLGDYQHRIELARFACDCVEERSPLATGKFLHARILFRDPWPEESRFPGNELIFSWRPAPWRE